MRLIKHYDKTFGYEEFKSLRMPHIVKLVLSDDGEYIDYELIDVMQP